MEHPYQLIDDYLDDKLDPQQRTDFESRIAADPELAETVQVQKSMRAFLIKENNKEQLVNQLNNLGDKHFKKTEAKTVSINRKKWISVLAVAASLALILVAYFRLSQPSLYEQFVLHEPINLVEKGESEAITIKAQNDYNTKNYSDAYKALDAYLQKYPDDTKAKLAKGISGLEMGKEDEAITIFEEIHTGSTAFKTTGTWYLALAYLKKRANEKAKLYLEQIPETDNYYYKKAQSLLSKL